MNGDDVRGILPPDGLRPAQLGVVFAGRVILGHLAATIADLAERGYLELIEEPGGDRRDWRVIDQRMGARLPPLLPYEATLTDGLFNGSPVVLLSDRAHDLSPVLDHVRSLIGQDARRHRWLRRWPHRDRRTPGGEQLLARIQVFRRELRAAVETRGRDGLGPAGPYAMIFGLGGQSEFGERALAHGGRDPAVGRRDLVASEQNVPTGQRVVPWASFAATWQASFVGCTCSRGPEVPEFLKWKYWYVQDWSAPRSHWRDSHVHSQVHDYHGAGFGHDFWSGGGGGGGHGGGEHGGGGGH